MTQITDAAYAQWQDDVKTSFVQVATSAMVQYTERFLSMPENGDIGDEAFVEIIAAIVRLHKEEGEQWLAVETGLDLAAIASWLHGGSLPKLSQRQLILKLCISEALGYVYANQMSIIGHLVSLEELNVALPRGKEIELWAQTTFTTMLDVMHGWDELPTRVRNSLRYDGILCFGDLLATSEAELLRIPNLGRKSFAELKTWLSNFGVSFSPTANKLLPVLRYWKIYHAELPRTDDALKPEEYMNRLGVSREVVKRLREKNIKTYGALACLTQEEVSELLDGDKDEVSMVEFHLRRNGLALGMVFPAWADLRP